MGTCNQGALESQDRGLVPDYDHLWCSLLHPLPLWHVRPFRIIWMVHFRLAWTYCVKPHDCLCFGRSLPSLLSCCLPRLERKRKQILIRQLDLDQHSFLSCVWSRWSWSHALPQTDRTARQWISLPLYLLCPQMARLYSSLCLSWVGFGRLRQNCQFSHSNPMRINQYKTK